MFMCQDHHIPGVYCSKKGSYGVLNYTPLRESGSDRTLTPEDNTVYDFDHVSVLCSANGKADNVRSSDIRDDIDVAPKDGNTYASSGTLFHIDQVTNPELQNVQANRFRGSKFFVFGVVDTLSSGNMVGKIVELNTGESMIEVEVAPGTNFVVGT